MATIKLELDGAEAVVLHNFLAREIDDANGKGFTPLVDHDGELWALNQLLCLLEPALTEPFEENFADLVLQAKEALVTRNGAWPK